MSELGERHGLDQWRLYGATPQASADGLAALGTDNRDPAALPGHIATLSTLLDTWRTFGLNIYLTQSDALLARLLIAAGQPEAARERLDTALALAQDTGMCFYDAELLRHRAHTHTDRDAIQADLQAALEPARRQGAALFELRAALDDFELRGDPARAALATALSRMPRESTMPEVVMARAALESTNSCEA